VTFGAFDDGLVEGFHFGSISHSVTSPDTFTGTASGVADRGDRLVDATAPFPAGNGLLGYTVRIVSGTGAGQVGIVRSNTATVLTMRENWETAPDGTSGYVIAGYTDPAVTTQLSGGVSAVAGETVTVTGAVLPTAAGGLSGATLRIVAGTGAGQSRIIAFNDATSITVASAWTVEPDGTSVWGVIDLTGIAIDRISALVGDDDVPGVLVTETNGSTRLIEALTSTDPFDLLYDDIYTLVLTAEPGVDVDVVVTGLPTPTLDDTVYRENDQVLVSLDGFTWSSSITLTFTPTGGSDPWDAAQTVYVRAIDDDYVDGSDLQAFADSSQRLYKIQGPLTVFGGFDPDADRSIPDPIVLPGEAFTSPEPLPDPAYDVIEENQVDTLSVYNNDSLSDDVGVLTSTRLTGLGMGDDLFVAGRLLPGGITYADLEALNIYLGHGADTLTIESTHVGTTSVFGQDGADDFIVNTVAGHTTIDAGEDDDHFFIGTLAPSLGAGVLDEILALLVIDGGPGTDVADVDDAGEDDDNLGTLTQTTLTGLDMVGSADLDRLYSLTLGAATGTFEITLDGVGTVVLPVGATAGEVEDALQTLLFPADDCGTLGVTGALDSVCARSVFVRAFGGDYLIGFRGEVAGATGPLLSITAGDGTATDLLRIDGINYYGLETLSIGLGTADDRFNVRGTLPHTLLDTGPGDDVVFVSDAADLAGLPAAIVASDGSLTDVHDAVLHGTVVVDDLTFEGSLDLIAGDLDIDTGAGSNTLAVSDRADPDADAAAVITDGSITGFSTGAITYVATGGDLAGQGNWALLPGAGAGGSGLFGRGITVHAGTGADEITISSVLGGATASSPLQMTITTLYANDGADAVTIDAPDVAAARLVVHGENDSDTIDATAAALALILFGDDGDDDIQGGSGADILFGDDGRVFLYDDGAGFDVILGGDPVAVPDSVVPGAGGFGPYSPDAIFETVDIVLTVTPGVVLPWVRSDIVRGGAGDDLVIGGVDDDALDGEADRDIVVGDHAIFTRHAVGTSPIVRQLAGDTMYDGVMAGHELDPHMGALGWTITLLDHAADTPAHLYGGDVAAGGADEDYVFGQLGNDTLHGDGVLDTTGVWSIVTSGDTTTDADDYVEGGGGNDAIHGGLGQDGLVGGSSDLFGLVAASQRPDGVDTIYGGNGDAADRNDAGDGSSGGHARDADVILGDNGRVFRIVGGTGSFPAFAYDTYDTCGPCGGTTVIPRVTEFLDYSPYGGAGYLSTEAPIHPAAPLKPRSGWPAPTPTSVAATSSTAKQATTSSTA
jgi:hypothetical protein